MTHSFRTAVVTGGAGFLGSHLCGRLLDRGCTVYCLDDFSTGSPANVAELRGEPRFHLVPCDITRGIDVAADVDLVLHFASPASPVDYLAMPVETLTVGSVGTANALELARRNAARFVLASTSEVYGDPLVHPQPETYWGNVNPIGPRSVYDEAKRFAEALTTAHRTSRGVDTAIVRLFNTYGPKMRSDDGRAIPTFIRQALDGAPVTVTGDGSQTRSVCFVDDTVTAVLAVAARDLAGPVNIGSSHEMSVLDLANAVIEAAQSRSRVRLIEPMADDPKVRRPDTSLIERELGWRPAVDWASGLRRTIDWFRSRTDPVTTAEPAVPDVIGASSR